MTAKQQFVFTCDDCGKVEKIPSSNWTDANQKIDSKGWRHNGAKDEDYCEDCRE